MYLTTQKPVNSLTKIYYKFLTNVVFVTLVLCVHQKCDHKNAFTKIFYNKSC